MYKNIIFLISMFFVSILSITAQNHIDALRFSEQFYSSTAKSDAMGNAFSAVGADMLSMTVNPAGIAVFNSSQFTFTPNFIISNTEGTFSGSVNRDNKFGLTVSNAGYVGVIPSSGIVKNINFGLGYNSTNDFRQRTVVSADNQSGSYLDFLVYNSNVDRYSNYREDLAYRAWLINYDDLANEYWSHVTDEGSYGVSQRKEINSKGGMGEFDLSVGANIADKFYIGTSIGVSSVNYREESVFSEYNYPLIYSEDLNNPGVDILVNPNRIDYKENLSQEGTGFNAKVGIIFQPVKLLRIAGAVQSSTFYTFSEEYYSSMYVDYPIADDLGYYDYEPESDINVNEWRLQTPFRANLGIAVILDSYEMGKFFTIPMTFSLDYDYVDYTKSTLRPDYYSDETFDIANIDIRNLYKEAHNFRAGAEVNLGAIKFRGGYAIYSSPLASDVKLFDNAKIIYSGGIGFASEHSFLDISYSYAAKSSTLYLYNANNLFPEDPIGSIVEPAADLKNNKQFIKVTLGLRF